MAGLEAPLYRQLADRLRREVAGLPSGTRIASEPQLAKRWGVSRFTVARAVAELADDGVIVRRQGAGSFMAEAPLRRTSGYLLSFTQAVEAAGHGASQRLLSFGPVPWHEGLPFDPLEPLVLLDRLRLVDGVKTARHRSVLAASLADLIGLSVAVASAQDFSLYGTLGRARLSVHHASERLKARQATDEERGLLDLANEAVVVAVVRHSFDANGRVLDAVDAVYDARRYSYEAQLVRRPDPHSVEETVHAAESRSPIVPGPRLGPWPEPRLGRARR